MSDKATPNLPSRSFEETTKFYEAIGFTVTYRDDGWLIIERGSMTPEFFRYPDLDPAQSSFGSCLRMSDIDDFYQVCLLAGVPERSAGFPRLSPVKPQHFGLRMGALLDPDGSLLRIISNESA